MKFFLGLGGCTLLILMLFIATLIGAGIVYGVSHGLNFLIPGLPVWTLLTFWKSWLASLVISGVRLMFSSSVSTK